MTDDSNDAPNDAPAGTWLSPGEALTRFVPGGPTHRHGARDLAPIRFGFQVGSIGLLIPTGMLSELVEDTEIYKLPLAPPWLRGLISLRGGLVPVFDLKLLFATESPDGAKPKLLALNTGAAAVSVLIDGLPLTVDVSSSLPQSPPLPGILRDYSYAVYAQGQSIWVDFDFDGFFRAVGNRAAA